MSFDFRFLNKNDGTKVLQIRTRYYETIPSKFWWKPWDIDIKSQWSDWHTIREEWEGQL